jgi:hypothetical protein
MAVVRPISSCPLAIYANTLLFTDADIFDLLDERSVTSPKSSNLSVSIPIDRRDSVLFYLIISVILTTLNNWRNIQLRNLFAAAANRRYPLRSDPNLRH